MGCSGVIILVVVLEFVEIVGVMINRVILYNYFEIEKKNIMFNDRVVVIRSGDVIFKIIKFLEFYRDGL